MDMDLILNIAPVVLILITVDKLTTIENKRDEILQENCKLQERNKQLIEEIEY